MKKPILLASILIIAAVSCTKVEKADLILLNAKVYTMEEDQPWASAIVIDENNITAVLENDRSAMKYGGPGTRVVDLDGKFVLPGFIDAHTHFDGTGAQLNDANLLAVADEEGLRKEIARVVDILQDGEWITRGLWGAYEQWALGASGAGAGSGERWMPDRQMIDDLTPDNPCLLRSFDGEWFLANTLAMEISGVDHMYPEDMVRDEQGRLTGLIRKGSPRLKDIQKVIQLKSHERLMKDLGKDLDGFRVIHAQVIRPEDFSRFKQLKVIAEVNPYHVSDDMRWMEERIGHERCKGAYAFRSLLNNGATLSFGSDMPGTSAAEYFAHPKYLLHAAVNRTTPNGEPAGGWFPEEKITVEEALKAYTINNAYAAFEADIRGSIKPGKLADITVCDLNLMEIPPEDILKMNIEMTIVDGKIVYERLLD
jgi:predicted amidohydrolase YtcJ